MFRVLGFGFGWPHIQLSKKQALHTAICFVRGKRSSSRIKKCVVRVSVSNFKNSGNNFDKWYGSYKRDGKYVRLADVEES